LELILIRRREFFGLADLSVGAFALPFSQ